MLAQNKFVFLCVCPRSLTGHSAPLLSARLQVRALTRAPKISMTKQDKKEFELIYEYMDAPEAEQKLRKAFDILFTEADLYEK